MVEISGRGARDFLTGESGTHRFCRCSPFDRTGRRHTSFVAVDVFGEAPGALVLREADLEISAIRKGGPGGQHQNKSSTGIRMRHLPTKTEVVVQSRSQQESLRMARRVLSARLVQQQELDRQLAAGQRRGERGSSSFGRQIRSYILDKKLRVVDHRSGVEVGDVWKVLDGDLDPLLITSSQEELTRTQPGGMIVSR